VHASATARRSTAAVERRASFSLLKFIFGHFLIWVLLAMRRPGSARIALVGLSRTEEPFGPR
jgi:hypothetical protein